MISARQVLPTRMELVPWTDKRGHFNRLRAAVFTLLLLPAGWLAVRWATHGLGADPLNAAVHSTGYWTIWLLLASLTVTPAKALSWSPNLVVVRRMVGNAALAYALLHLALYATDQKWRLGTIASEILLRFYLTIGFVALLGLVALGLTSTDGWARALGRAWKRLHKVVFIIAPLGLFHYVLQSKLDVSQALLAVGVFAWLVLWRVLPAGRDREWLPLLGIGLLAAGLTLAVEYAWYRLGTRVDPMKVVRGELDIDFGLGPVGRVLFLGLVATALAEMRRLANTAFGGTAMYMVIVFAAAGLVGDGASLFLGWQVDAPDGSLPYWPSLACSIALLGVLGFVRWMVRQDWSRHVIDALLLACVLDQLLRTGMAGASLGPIASACGVGGVLVVVRRYAERGRLSVARQPRG